MLKPAYMYKTEIEKEFAKVMYDDDYFLYMGYPHGHELPKIEPRDNVYQWAIIGKEKQTNDMWDVLSEVVEIPRKPKEKVIGYFAYQIQPETDTVLNFGLYSFDRGNVQIGYDIYNKMKELVSKYRRIEWRVIDGNPVVRHYDKFCKKNNGNRVTFHKVIQDTNGIYRDEHVYEIVKPSNDNGAIRIGIDNIPLTTADEYELYNRR